MRITQSQQTLDLDILIMQQSLPFPASLRDDEYYHISSEGLAKICENYDPKDPQKNMVWSADYRLELPLRMKKFGHGSEQPLTLVDKFQETVSKYGDRPALSVKRENKWQTITYKQYYQEVVTFANALLSLDITPYRAVNILGFNAPEWFISFYGSIFGYYLPVGIYTTNGPEACQYVTSHSDCELVVLENRTHLAKYLKVWGQLPDLKYIVVYDDANIPEDFVPASRRGQVLQWKAFMELGRKYLAKVEENSVENRMKKQKPGNCCTLVYTSGTTGPPKGVMLTHDNYVWPGSNVIRRYELQQEERIVSYLPLSHVAAQLIDIVTSLFGGTQVFFAGPDALQGSLVETLKDIRPTFFFSVPRVWEKIDEKMKQIATSNGFVKKSIANWAKGMGREGTFAETHKLQPPFCFGLAKKLVYNNVKKALGLDQARFLVFGAAPLSPVIRDYFLSLNMFLINGYGMSECAGATTLSDPENFDAFDSNFLVSTGRTLEGTEIKIFNPDKDGNGEICYRGRHIFRGYYKNEQATRETIDRDGYLHSGDVGKLDKRGNLSITGRIKELLITAGGENVAPVLIENEIKEELKFVANCMVIGDARKFLTCILTLKYVADKAGVITNQLTPEVLQEFVNLGSSATTVEQVRKDPVLIKFIDAAIERANQKAISKAQWVRKWYIIDGDFTVEGGDLTPTLKLKRKVVTEKHSEVIEKLYEDPKL